MILHPRTVLFIVSVFLSCVQWIRSASVAPTWITSTYVQANSNKVINGGPVGSSASPVPSATMNFATAFTAAPNLGYGVSGYEGTIKIIKGMIS